MGNISGTTFLARNRASYGVYFRFQSDDIYLEAQIQNITPGPIYLERVPLEPSPLYSVREFTTDGTNSG